MAEHIVVYGGDGMLLCGKEQWRGRILLGLGRTQGIDAEWKEQNQENYVYRGRYTVVNLNVMVFFTSSCNAETQNNAEGLLNKRAATHIQRKNCENRNTEKANYQNSWVDGDTTEDIETKQPI